VFNAVSWPDDEVDCALFGDRQVMQLHSYLTSTAENHDFRQYKNNTSHRTGLALYSSLFTNMVDNNYTEKQTDNIKMAKTNNETND